MELLPPPLPTPRGPLSDALLAALRDSPEAGDDLPALELPAGDPLDDDDLHLALYAIYELAYRGFAAVDDAWEWEPSLLALRARLERAFLGRVLEEVGHPDGATDPASVPDRLWHLATNGGGPSLSGFMAERGTVDHLREFAVHRSAYQLKEADPHTFGIPRLAGGPKAAMVRIQADEYGAGHEAAMHATLFARTMRALGLDATYGAFLGHLPGATLATCNLVSLFGLHRRWRGALVGHLALFEMTSVGPMGRYARALRRLGFDADARRFYDVHVEADAEHQVIAAGELAGAYARQEPARAGDVLFGAAALTFVERRFTEHLLGSWHAGRTSLRLPLGSVVGFGPESGPNPTTKRDDGDGERSDGQRAEGLSPAAA